MQMRRKGQKDRTQEQREARRRQEELVDEMIGDVVERGELIEDARGRPQDLDLDPSEEGRGFVVDSSEPEEQEGAESGGEDGGGGTAGAPKRRGGAEAMEDSDGGQVAGGKARRGRGKGKGKGRDKGDAGSADKPRPRGPRKGRGKGAEEGPKLPPRPNVMSLWREISGDVTHLFNYPGLNAGEDREGSWCSDRHIFFTTDENVTTFTPDHMVDFDEDASFRWKTFFDDHYQKELKVSDLSHEMEICDEGKSAFKRNETGDMVTDHVISHYLMNLILDYKAVSVNITATNWSAPAGWRKGRTGYNEQPSWRWRPPRASFAVWGESKESGVSRWVLYIDQKFGDFYIGALVEPASQLNCSATRLRSDAWFLSDMGYAYQTSKDGKEELDQFVAAQMGMDCWPPHFASSSLVWMELDRDRGTLQITVNSLPPFAFYHVDPRAVPFINVCFPDDGATLLSVEEAIIRTPINLRNDAMARWSVTEAQLRRTPIPDSEMKTVSKKKMQEETVEVSFWPGGRLKTHGGDVEKEYQDYAAWWPNEKEQAAIVAGAPELLNLEPDV